MSLLLQVNLSLIEAIAVWVWKHIVLESCWWLRFSYSHFIKLFSKIPLWNITMGIEFEVQPQIFIDTIFYSKTR